MTSATAVSIDHRALQNHLRTEERMGRIVAVTGAHAIILLDVADNVFDENKKGAEIGTLMKVETPTSITLALISALSSPTPSHGSQEQELRIVEVEFIGELPKDEKGNPKAFRRGVSNYPSLGDLVYRANRNELYVSMCHARHNIGRKS